MNNRPRYKWIDISKGIAILAVILGHTYSIGNPLHAITYSFHIPLFFIVAGYTFSVKPMKLVLTSSAKRLLLPYLSLCGFILIIQLVRSQNLTDTLSTMLISILFASSDPHPELGVAGIGIAWYLMALFIVRVILNLITSALDKLKANELVRFLIFALIACGGIISYRYLLLPFSLNSALIALFFLYLGYTLKKYGILAYTSKWYFALVLFVVWMLLLVNGTFFSIGNIFYINPAAAGILMLICGAMSVINLSIYIEKALERLRIANAVSNFLAFCGINSMIILCMHCFESSFISWPSSAYASSSFMVYTIFGLMHIAMVLIMTWTVYLSPITASTVYSSDKRS